MTDYGSMTGEQAQVQIDEILRDETHAYHARTNAPGREAAQDHMTHLFAVRHPEEKANPVATAAKVSPEFTNLMADAVTEKAARDEAVVVKLRKDMRAEIQAVNASMDGTDLNIEAELKDPTLARLEGFRQMAYLGRGDYKHLTPLLLDDCQAVGIDQEKIEAAQTLLLNADSDDVLAVDNLNILIKHVCAEKERKQ